MEFEFDPAKSAANKEKHGLDFTEAHEVWADERRVLLPLSFADEERFIVVGEVAGKLWSAVFTWRGTKIRIISVRRARDDEKQNYES